MVNTKQPKNQAYGERLITMHGLYAGAVKEPYALGNESVR